MLNFEQFVGVYIGFVLLTNLVIFGVRKEIDVPLKAVLCPLNLILVIYGILFGIHNICCSSDLESITKIMEFLLLISVIPLALFIERPCRFHIWMVERLLESEHEHVEYLKKLREMKK